MSATVTVKDALPVLRASVALQVTVVVASANVDPEAGVQVGGAIPDEVGRRRRDVTTAPFGPVASTVMLAGTVTPGPSCRGP